MKVDIIIPNYNGAHLIEHNLASVVHALNSFDGRVIIVDDGSKLEEQEKLEEFISKFKNKDRVDLFIKSKNSGFPGTVNLGVKKSSAKYVVLLNSDVVPREDFLKSPIEKLENDDTLFGVGCMDESIEGSKKVARGRGLSYWSNGFLHHKRGDVDRDNTFWISGGSSVIRRELFEKLGGFDEIYAPFYWEDIDLSFRAQKAGFSIKFDNQSIVEHYHHEGAIKKHYSYRRITTISYRNQFIFIWKNITTTKYLLNHFFYLPINIFGAIFRFDLPFLQGLFLAILLLPAIINRRFEQQKFLKVSDEKVIGSNS
jgi:GT2 family glycosyltransferase